MTQQQHLQKIKDKCEQLLEHSKNKAQGNWRRSIQAGFMVTIASIECLKPHPTNPNDEGRRCMCNVCETVKSIIAAWPEELL